MKRFVRVLGYGCAYPWWWLWVRGPLTVRFAARKYPLRFLSLLLWLAVFAVSVRYLWFNIDDLWTMTGFDAAHGWVLSLIVSLLRIPKDMRTLLAQSYTKEFLAYLKLLAYARHIGEVSEMRKDIQLLCDLRLGVNSGDHPCWLGAPRVKRRLLFIIGGKVSTKPSRRCA